MKLIEFQQQKEIPDYLKSKSGLASQVLFVTIFALLFVNIYKPFTSGLWGDVSTLEYFLWSLAVVFIGFITLVISRILLYYYSKKHRVFYWVYALWVFVEISVMAIAYTSIAKYAMPKTSHINGGTELVDFFWSTFFSIFFILLIPTMISWLYLAFSQKKLDLQRLQKKVQENPLITVEQPSVLQFKDEKGELKFSVKADSVMWIEAADNYVIIKYQNQDKLSDFLLRNSLKHLSEDFQDTPLFRCHRSYMVNVDHAVALKKGPDGLIIEMDIPGNEVPVSKSYKEETTRAFMQYGCKK